MTDWGMAGETITVQHPTGSGDPDEYGETITTYTDETVAGCAIAPGDTREDNDRQATVEVAFTVYAPPGTIAEPGARVIVRGATYEVDGQPADWRDPFDGGTPAGVVIALTRAQ